MDSYDAEIRGLFFGEGCLDIVLNGYGKHPTLRARLGMTACELPALESLRERFGGSIDHRPGGKPNHPRASASWLLVGKKRVLPLLHVLADGTLPSSKRPQVELMLEAAQYVPVPGKHRTTDQTARLHEIRRQLQLAKRT